MDGSFRGNSGSVRGSGGSVSGSGGNFHFPSPWKLPRTFAVKASVEGSMEGSSDGYKAVTMGGMKHIYEFL